MARRHIGLVMHGGGAFGAYECGVVKALNEHYDHFLEDLDVVSGVSIGAINAAMLVGARGDDPVKALENMWLNHFAIPDVPFLPPQMRPFFAFRGMLGTPGMSYIRPELFFMPWTVNSCYDTAPLSQTLEKLIDINKINTSTCSLMVGATNLETGEFTWFRNPKDKSDNRKFSYDMIRASGALIPFFPPIGLTDQETGRSGHFCDGGFLYNLPLLAVAETLAEFINEERLLIIVELFPLKGEVPASIFDVPNRITQMTFSSKVLLNGKFFGPMFNYLTLIKILESPEMQKIIKTVEEVGVQEIIKMVKEGLKKRGEAEVSATPLLSRLDEIGGSQPQQAYKELGQIINQAKDEINKDPQLKKAYSSLPQSPNGSQADEFRSPRGIQAQGLQSPNALQSPNGRQDYIPPKHLVITSRRSEPFSAACDFSRAAIEKRIDQGYQDTYDAIRDFEEQRYN